MKKITTKGMDGGTVEVVFEGDGKPLEKETDKVESNLKGKFSNIGSFIGKSITAGVAVASGALVALTKSSLEQYAQFEQNIGGIETLFALSEKDIKNLEKVYGKSFEEIEKEMGGVSTAADNLKGSATEAYKTAGMSANEYMQTVTSFSASLIKSLGDDTYAAADYADRAIRDMSDNANKMGTDMGLIQNAYQGFAKQNYTIELMSA